MIYGVVFKKEIKLPRNINNKNILNIKRKNHTTRLANKQFHRLSLVAALQAWAYVKSPVYPSHFECSALTITQQI